MPGADRLVVVNTTPVVALAGLKRLDLFQLLYGEILVPPAVWHELKAGGLRPGGLTELAVAPWIRIGNLRAPRSADLFADLGRGEAEVIALALEVEARLVVLDDRLGRRHAARLGLDLTGTAGLLVVAKECGFIERIGPLLDQAVANGIYLSDRLQAWARTKCGES